MLLKISLNRGLDKYIKSKSIKCAEIWVRGLWMVSISLFRSLLVAVFDFDWKGGSEILRKIFTPPPSYKMCNPKKIVYITFVSLGCFELGLTWKFENRRIVKQSQKAFWYSTNVLSPRHTVQSVFLKTSWQ